MIYDKIENIDKYLGLSSNLDETIRYIMTGKYKNAEFGKNIVSGEEIYYNCPKDAMAKNDENMEFEYHRTYIDIHIPIEGKENIALLQAEDGEETKAYDAEHDYGLYRGKSSGKFCVKEGEFMILFPEEIHIALVKVEAEATPIHKVIFKVKA